MANIAELGLQLQDYIDKDITLAELIRLAELGLQLQDYINKDIRLAEQCQKQLRTLSTLKRQYKELDKNH